MTIKPHHPLCDRTEGHALNYHIAENAGSGPIYCDGGSSEVTSQLDADLIRRAAVVAERHADMAEWHTLTVTMNGQHGGADVVLEGSKRTTDGIPGFEYVTYKAVLI